MAGFEKIPLNREEPTPGELNRRTFISQEREAMEGREEREKEKIECPLCKGSLEVYDQEGEERFYCAKDGFVVPNQEKMEAA